MTSALMEPRVIITSGMATGGKTTVAKKLVRTIPNAVYFARDDAMYGGLLLVDNIVNQTDRLPPFEEYVRADTVFPDFAQRVETPFGPMTLVIHANRSAFYIRHVNHQSYLVAARFAQRNLEMGKVVVIDAYFGPEDFEQGMVKAFIDQPAFAPYPRYLIYFNVEARVAFERWKAREDEDPESALRASSGYLVWETFLELTEKRQIPNPKGLDTIPHLRLDTSHLSIEETLATCFQYIQS